MTTIAIINKVLLKKKLLLSIDFNLVWNSVAVLSWSLFWVHIMNAIVITEDSNDIGPNDYVQNSAIKKVWFDKKFELFFEGFFPQNFSNCHLLYFS